MEYKNTLNLPKTDFPMKADLPKREPLYLKIWADTDLYRKIQEKPANKGKYVLHDGPPYANGDIHIGHALNKTLKDMIVKYKAMQGFRSPYMPGWDCHGLPIEHQLLKELKITKYQISQIEFRKKAYEYAMKYVSSQREQFKRLGVFGDWENPYLTLSREYEEAIVSSFNELFRQGYIKRGLKPVNWCYRCETALAEAEVEYADHSSPSVFVKFKLQGGQGFPEGAYLVIWTTTPWTLIANVAVAVHPGFSYSHYRTQKGDLILADERAESCFESMGIVNPEKIATFRGADLEGKIYEHPFGLRKGKVVLAEYVSREEGSGLVHTAPGHGAEDYLTGVKYGLEIVMPVDSRGKFDKSAGEFAGLNVFDANKLILEKLNAQGTLLWSGALQHSYPHCWRCKSPIIFRATKQWFLMIDHKDLRKKVLEAIKDDVSWIPSAGQERISSMVALRPDWCLSRQRYWGVPVPALVCGECKEEFFDERVTAKFAEFVSREGTDSWFTKDIKEFLPLDLACPLCKKGKTFSKGTDILDVWFDSGVSSQAVLKKRKDLGGSPAELYLEGSDQHRGWFQSSIIPGICIDGKPPFKTVLTHGFVVDGEGRKMSKSLGNVISPQDIIKDYGADILRMWVASSDYNDDIRISKEILARLSEAYRKIRNTARFILSNLYDFNPGSDMIGPDKLRKIDKWMLYKQAAVLADTVVSGYEKFEFHKAYKAIYDFCNEDLSMYYLDMIKGRLYTYAANSPERRAAQTTIYETLNLLVRLMAPILTFTSEEIWQGMPKPEKEKAVPSVHLLNLPDPAQGLERLKEGECEKAYNEIEEVLKLVPEVAKVLEEKRSQGAIGSSFDAKINLLTNTEERYKFLTSLKSDLCEIFKVSQVSLEKDEAASGITIETLKAEGKKCVRCWNYSESVGRNKTHDCICDNCLKAIGG